MAKPTVVLPVVFLLLLFVIHVGAVPLPPLGPDGRYSMTPQELFAFALAYLNEAKLSDDAEATELKKLVTQLDISNKILNWLQGIKIFAPMGVVFVAWIIRSSHACFPARAANPFTWRKNWLDAKKAREEAKSFSDIKLGILGAQAANSKLSRFGGRMDDMDARITSNHEESHKMMRSIIIRVGELERGRAGPRYDGGTMRNRGGGFQNSSPRTSPRRAGGHYSPEHVKVHET